MEWARERGPESVVRVNRLFREVEWPETMPAFGLLYADTENKLWVRQYRVGYDPDVPFDVFDTAGVYVGMVTLPEGLEPLEIGPDYVIGLWRDEQDVGFVRVHGMRRR